MRSYTLSCTRKILQDEDFHIETVRWLDVRGGHVSVHISEFRLYLNHAQHGSLRVLVRPGDTVAPASPEARPRPDHEDLGPG